MSLGKILVFADEESNLIPEILLQVRLQAITNTFSLSDVD
jgi:hypothetical protein